MLDDDGGDGFLAVIDDTDGRFVMVARGAAADAGLLTAGLLLPLLLLPRLICCLRALSLLIHVM